MTSQYKIIIENMSAQTMSFYAFQKQASFTDSGAPLDILSNSLASGPLASHGSSGAQLDFAFDTQVYAGAKVSLPTSSSPMPDATISMPSADFATSEASATQPIQLTTANPNVSTGNSSTLTISPLGLSTPIYQSDVPVGYFGIEVPSYVPNSLQGFYCGCATINQDGSIVLSSYVTPLPSSQLYCAPIPYYYVNAGSFPVGDVIPYDTSRSGSCDFSSGYSTINVQYNSDGSFSITGSF